MKTLAIIFLTLISFSGFAQQGKLSGKITSEGSTVAFANVYIKASNLGTTADKDGKFLLKNIPAGNHSIEISAIGFKKFSRNILINARSKAKRLMFNWRNLLKNLMRF